MLASEIRILTPRGRERIHTAALEVLERTGIAVEEAALRGALGTRGARVSASDVVRIPRELVGECLATVDRAPVLRCVNGKVLGHGPEDRHYSALVTDPYIIDYRDGVRRPRLDDIARHARLGDALPLVDSIHLMDDTIPDLDTRTSELKCLEVFVGNTTTAYHCAPGSLRAARTWIEIAEIMAGGSLKQNPILGAYVPSVSPLVLAEVNTGQLRMFLDAGVMCNLGPCGIAGATAPFPVAGLLAQSWAEFLALVVAAQVIAPGAAVLGGGGGAHHMDPRTGGSLYSGWPKALASAAMNELCAGFGIPVHSGNLSTLVSNYGVQNGMESALGAFATFFAPSQGFGSLGSLANACGMSAAQIVLHHDLIEMLERFRRGIDVTDEKLSVAAIAAVGPRGDFLEDELTLKYLRSDEHFFASSFEQCAGAADLTTMVERAQQRAEQLMATHRPAVPAERLAEVARYVERELGRAGAGVA
jgi:trimethylamine--corrinoid protein Co-methyltransferase